MLSSNISISGKQYKMCGLIGEGGAAVVYLAKDRRENSCAIKKIKNYKDSVIKQMVDAEIRIQKLFEGNKYVIQYLGYEKIQDEIYIALELGQCSLRNWMEASKQFLQVQLINVLCDVCSGLMSIHDKKIIHRDIKPENIIKKNNVYKITDFGVSCERQQDQNVSGTPLYWAPQILFEQVNVFTSKVDVWSFGVTVFQTYFKVNPFCPDKSLSFRKSIDQMKKNIKKLTPKFTIQKFIELLKQKDLRQDVIFVERKIKNTGKNLIQNLCLFFEPNPQKRPDIDLLYVLFLSLRNQIQMPEIKKTAKTPKFQSWQTIPQDIRLVCAAKDLVYEFNAFYKFKLYDKAIFGLQLAIWYLQGANYGGINYIFLDKINYIKTYHKSVTQLWTQVKTLLSQFYFYLKCEQQVKSFDKLTQLRIHILLCSVWKSIMNEDKYFCDMVSKITGLQIQYPLELFSYLQLYSDKNINQIQQRIINRFYV